MRRTALLVAVLLLGGCASSGGSRPTVPTSSTPSSSSPVAAVTLTATVDGSVPAVRRILTERLSGLGVPPSRVDAAGATLTFGLPRRLSDTELATLGRAGFLAFRPVLAVFPPDGPSTAEGTGDCSVATDRQRIARRFGGSESAHLKVVACDADGSQKYDLGPVELTGTAVKTATAAAAPGPGPGSQWVVSLEFVDAGRWADVTETSVGRQLAIVLDGEVQSAPTIQERIPDGNAQVSGSFTEEQAKALAVLLRFGALPATATLSQSG